MNAASPADEPGRAGRAAPADVLLAALCAVLPLLPYGPRYLGLPDASWPELGLVALAALWLARRQSPRWARIPAPRLRWSGSLTIFLAAITGAAILSIASDNVLTSGIFLAHLADLPARLFTPMHMVRDPMYGVRVWLTLVEGPLAFVLTSKICRRSPEPMACAARALTGTAAGLLLVSTLAVVQYATRYHLHPYWVAANPLVVRAHSTLDDPNTLGAYLVFAGGVIAWLGWGGPRSGTDRPRRRTFQTWLSAVASVMAAAALPLTGSRAAVGAAGISTIAMLSGPLALRHGRAGRVLHRTSQLVAILAVAAALAWMAARVWLPDRTARQPTGLADSYSVTVDPRAPVGEVLKGRERLWSGALGMAGAHPLTGVGLGRFPRLVNFYLPARVPVENAHNFYLQLLAETGALGLGAWLLLAGVTAIAVWRAAAETAKPDVLASAARGAVLGGIALSLTLLTGHALLLPSMQLVVGTVLGCVLWNVPGAGPSRDRPPAPSRGAVTLVAAAVFSSYLVAAFTTRWQPLDAWGYNWGLFAPERADDGEVFRWTGREARLLLPVMPDATSLTLAIAGFVPAGARTSAVTIEAAGRRRDLSLTGAWTVVDLPLDRLAGARQRPQSIEVVIHAPDAASPAAVEGSSDRRVVGVRLRPPAFVTGRR